MELCKKCGRRPTVSTAFNKVKCPHTECKNGKGWKAPEDWDKENKAKPQKRFI